jgi:hypothetical protein
MTLSSRRWLAILLLLFGVGLIALGLWRLAVGRFGTPEQLFWLSPEVLELTAERIDQRIARQERAVKKARDAGLEVEAKLQTLEEMRAGREEWVRSGEQATTRARWREFRIGLGLLVGGGLLIAGGWRRLYLTPS